MRILSKYKVRIVAGENIVMVQGANPGDMTTVIALNKSSLYLWHQLEGVDFGLDDVVRLLMEQYNVEESQARKDAEKWIDTLRINLVID